MTKEYNTNGFVRYHFYDFPQKISLKGSSLRGHFVRVSLGGGGILLQFSLDSEYQNLKLGPNQTTMLYRNTNIAWFEQ